MELSADSIPDPSPNPHHPVIGVLILFAAALVHALSLGWCMNMLSSFEGNEFVDFLLPICVLFPTVVSLGFALTLPLLWIPGVIVRSALAVLLPLSLWCVFLVGMSAVSAMPADVKQSVAMSAIFLLGVAGALIPVGFVMWFFQWRLDAPGYAAAPARIGIVDLLILTTFGAVVFAFVSRLGPMANEGADLRIMLLLTTFYGSIGAISSLSALLTMRVFLGADRRPFSPANLVGIGMTIGLVFAVWALPLFTEGNPVGDPWLMLFLLSVLTWSLAALTAYVMCWWLRRYRFRLTNAAIEKSLSPHTVGAD